MVENDSVIQMVLLFVLVLERIFKLFVNSHCYKKFSIKSSSLGSFEIETEEQPQNDDKKDEKE
jgi:hypothetical protein